MKREILFRGKCVSDSKYAGQWVEGGYVPPYEDSETKEALIVVFYGENSTSTYHVIPETVGQYTGLIDKNGKRIFEGDIVLMENVYRYGACRGVVKWDNDGYWYTDYKGDYDQRIHGAWGFVIGNIHDNPELLKGGEE